MLEILVKLLLALLVGILIGFEREYRAKAAGLVLLPMICIGALLFTLIAGVPGNKDFNPPLAAGVVTGVGFLGVGVILREQGHVSGLTTAAVVWISAALGMGIGFGYYPLVGMAAALVLLLLWFSPLLQLPINSKANDSFTYELTAPLDEGHYTRCMQQFKENDLTIIKHRMAKKGTDMVCFWQSVGKPQGHDRLQRAFMLDAEVKEFTIT